MKRKAERFTRGLARIAVCPFCGHDCDATAALTWCAGCFVEWRQTRGEIVFDDQLRTPSFAWAKAIARAGGARIGE